MSICHFTSDGNINHFIKVLSVRFLYYKTTLFPFVINRYPEGDTLNLYKYPISPHTYAP